MWSLTDNVLISGLAALLLAVVVNTWREHVSSVKAVKHGHYALEKTILEDYWDKHTTQAHVELVLAPILQSIGTLVTSNLKLSESIQGLTEKLADSNARHRRTDGDSR